MEIRHLRYFVAMAEAGSLMKASERLHIAQPALSVHLANLEAELGVKLVARSNRGIVLTDEGEELYKRAGVLLRYHAEAIEALRTRKIKPVGAVSVGIPSTLSAQLAAPLHRALQAELPEVTLYLIEASTQALYEWLQNGRIDFAVLFSVPEQVGLDVTPLYMEDFYLVGPVDDGRPKPSDIEFTQVCDYPLVLPRQSSSWRKVLDQAAEKCGKTLTCRLETESMAAMKALAAASECYAILPQSALIDDVHAGRLSARRIVNPLIRGLLSISNLEATQLSVAHRAVRDLIVGITRDFDTTTGADIFPFYSQQVLPGSLLSRQAGPLSASRVK